MPTIAELKQAADNPANIFKALQGTAWVADMDVDLPDDILDATGVPIDLAAAGWVPVGLVTKDGYTFGVETETAEVMAHGYSSTLRTDITGATRSVTFTGLEGLGRTAIELAFSVDLSAIEPAVSNGSVVYDEPDRPLFRERRLLVIGADKDGDQAVYKAKGFPRTSVTSFPEEVWNENDPTQYAITMNVYPDSEVGTPVRNYIGGPGFDGAAAGFTGTP